MVGSPPLDVLRLKVVLDVTDPADQVKGPPKGLVHLGPSLSSLNGLNSTAKTLAKVR